MELDQEKEQKVNRVVDALAKGNPDIKNSPSTKVMAINLLQSFSWDIEKTMESLG